MAAHNVSPLEIERAIQAANVRQTAGDFRNNDRLFASKPASLSPRPASRRPGRRRVRRPAGLLEGRGQRRGRARGSRQLRPPRLGTGAGSPSTSSSPARSWVTLQARAAVGIGQLTTRHLLASQPVASRIPPRPSRSPLPRRKARTRSGWPMPCLREAEKLRRTIVPDDMELVVTRNYGLTANEKVNELVEGLAVAVLIVVALLTLGLGMARGADRRGRRAGRLRADAGRESDAGLHHQPRDAVRA